MLRNYTLLDYEWTPLTQNPCWHDSVVHHGQTNLSMHMLQIEVLVMLPQAWCCELLGHGKCFADDFHNSRICKTVESRLCVRRSTEVPPLFFAWPFSSGRLASRCWGLACCVLCGLGRGPAWLWRRPLWHRGVVLPGLRGVLAGFRRCPARAVWHHCWLRASFSFERSCLHQKRRIQKQMGNPFRPHDATKRDEQPQHNMHQHDFAADRVRRRTLVPQTGLRCRLFPGYL